MISNSELNLEIFLVLTLNDFLEQISEINNFTFFDRSIDLDGVILFDWFKVIFDNFFPYNSKLVSN